MKKIIVLKLKGGLGNQLFSYAFSLHLAYLNQAILYIDTFTGFKFDKIYKRHYALENFNLSANILPNNFYNKNINPFLYKFLRKIINKHPNYFKNFLLEKNIEFNKNLLEYKFQSRCFIEGYFQSEKYFLDIEHIIRKEFKITPPTDIENIIFSNMIKSKINSVMIHIRWFDKLNSKNNAAKEYYTLAIEYLNKNYNDLHFFVFSDDLNLAKIFVEELNIKFTLIMHNDSEEKAYADLWLMTLCNNFIIANSTFSWWGAWLSEYKGKIVIAPKMKANEISAWGFDDLLPEHWVQI